MLNEFLKIRIIAVKIRILTLQVATSDSLKLLYSNVSRSMTGEFISHTSVYVAAVRLHVRRRV